MDVLVLWEALGNVQSLTGLAGLKAPSGDNVGLIVVQAIENLAKSELAR